MSEFDYEEMTQEALRGVVRSVLKKVAAAGALPGEHHFFIEFDTRAEGVGLSRRLMEQYPQEMMVVLQHRFWDLKVHDDYFEVQLTFGNVPEKLVIPYRAIKVFFDPSVSFGLQFEPSGGVAQRGQSVSSSVPAVPPIPPLGDDGDTLQFPLENEHDAPQPVKPAPPQNGGTQPAGQGKDDAKPDVAKKDESEDEDEGSAKGGAEVVQLDAFRKS